MKVSTADRRPVIRTVLVALGGLLWVVAPVVSVAVLTQHSASTQLRETGITWVPVDPNRDDIRRPVSLQATWNDSGDLVAPPWSGVVQRVDKKAGDTVATGDSLVRISGITRLAVHSSEPFYRALGYGDTGTDVAALNAVLVARGLEAGDADEFTSATGRGVGALAAELGVAGGAEVETFDPAWVVYLPRPEGKLLSFDVSIGAAAPSGVFGALAPSLQATQLLERTAIVAAEEELDAAAVRPISADVDWRLEVAGIPFELDPARTGVAAASLTALDAVLADGVRVVDAELLSAASEGEWVVPSASVVVDASGGYCLVVMHGDVVRTEPAVLAGSDSGMTIVTAELAEGDLVAIAPPAEARRACD